MTTQHTSEMVITIREMQIQRQTLLWLLVEEYMNFWSMGFTKFIEKTSKNKQTKKTKNKQQKNN